MRGREISGGGGEHVVSPYRSFRNVGRFFSSVKWRADVLMPSPIVCVLGRVCLSCILFEGFVFIRRIFFCSVVDLT